MDQRIIIYFRDINLANQANNLITNEEKHAWKDGITTEWCTPISVLDDKGIPMSGIWYLIVKQEHLKLLENLEYELNEL